jgi:hypothetical protein
LYNVLRPTGVPEGKKIYLFGVEFIDRNVGEWVVEKTF